MKGTPRLAGHVFTRHVQPKLNIYTPESNQRRTLTSDGMVAAPGTLHSKQIAHLITNVPAEKTIEVVGSPRVAMQDWDWPDDAHIAKQAITINHLGDVYDSMERFTRDNPDELWRMYITPGGVRAYDMAQRRDPNSAYRLQSHLNSDPLYAELSDKTGFWNTRISPKPARDNDFVALPIGSIGTGTMLRENEDYVRRFHDVPIMENRIAVGQTQLPESAYNLLEQQAQTLPGHARPMIDPILSRMYARLNNASA